MFNKTTSSHFLKYGFVSREIPRTNLQKQDYTIFNENTTTLISYSKPVYIEPMEGMALLHIAKEEQLNQIETFALHRKICIYPGNAFALVTMSNYIVYNLYMPKESEIKKISLAKTLMYHRIKPSIRIQELLAYYYVVKRPHYQFKGEIHPYYELTFVDQGELETTVEDETFTLKANDCLFYGPGQFHNQKVTSENPCSYLTAIFEADGLCHDKLVRKIYHCNREEIQLIQQFVKYTEFENDYQNDLLVSSLETFIIQLQSHMGHSTQKTSSPANQHYENSLLEEIVQYINLHLYEPLPIDSLCDNFAISRSTLQNLFNNYMKITPKAYINNEKLNLSRLLIRDGKYSITQVANLLGFNSIHYFSRKFTRKFHINPSEYAKKIYDQL
ncbi:AraC family transcriptional regulator [Bulleidia sp. zg-1006]|uniref:AraC family transcriptional regulator n=1 Tax=Bulleidia sp. zg-1006 TaxID=2806552 RepID=UPI00193ADC87|nr:AraC family transcriptional regulator [Bulleidia sp. zg-1006]QRG86639.1 AraC family transcriptional regulator [Bulleidia sp. zg-1006]